MNRDWNIWVIKHSKFKYIESFLEREVPEVTEVFFPTAPKEFKSGNKIFKKRVPLYKGYLFLKYKDVDNKVFYKLKSNPFFTTYVGRCTDSSVVDMKNKEEWNVLNKEVTVGDKVQVISGPFNKCKGTVNAINGNKVTIKTILFGRDIDHVLCSDDLEIIDRE